MSDSHNGWQRFIRKHPRLAGMALGLFGLGLIYWMVYLPIQQAKGHTSSIFISVAASVFGVMALLVGSIYLIAGETGVRVLNPRAQESKVPPIFVGAMATLIGLCVYIALKAYLKSEGYGPLF
jgi:hypothetical protein